MKVRTMPGNNLELTRAPSVEVAMLIRRPPRAVFEALVDPGITTRFWFTKSSGRLRPGAMIRWEWEIFGAEAKVWVREFEENRRVVFDWGDDEHATTTVEFRIVPHGDGGAYLQVTETGIDGDGDDVVARALDSTNGFTFMVCALKALLEHDVVLSVVPDAHPPDLEL
jgi:uncharacterized protein YndB with AHSA1/START domain